MAEQETPTESQSSPSSHSSSAPQSEETGSMTALKTTLWFLVLPAAVVLLIKWLMGI